MQPKKKTLHRITGLYVLLFVVVVLSIAFSFSNVTGEYFRTGRNDALRMHSETAQQGKHIEIVYDVLAATSNMDFDIPVYSATDGDVTVNARPSSLDVEFSSTQPGELKGTGTTFFFMLIGTLTYVAIFVIIFIILTSLRRSIRREGAFKRLNIKLTRAIGILLIAGSLLFSFVSYLESHSLAEYFTGSGYYINTSFRFNFGEIITGCLVFVIAEIFSISYSISEENKLTI